MLKGEQIAEANLTDWRKLAQGLHARYVIGDFGTGARFVAAVGEAGDALGHHPRVSIGKGYVDLKLVSDDAIYRDDAGTEHQVEWVTEQDVDLARRISEIAAAVTAGGMVVDDSQAPSYTVIADQDGNKACVCTTLPAAQKR